MDCVCVIANYYDYFYHCQTAECRSMASHFVGIHSSLLLIIKLTTTIDLMKQNIPEICIPRTTYTLYYTYVISACRANVHKMNK